MKKVEVEKIPSRWADLKASLPEGEPVQRVRIGKDGSKYQFDSKENKIYKLVE